MSNTAKDGGPAFAQAAPTMQRHFQSTGQPFDETPVYPTATGMTLRQYYKAVALQGMVRDITLPGNHAREGLESLVLITGIIADAMLAEDAEHAKK